MTPIPTPRFSRRCLLGLTLSAPLFISTGVARAQGDTPTAAAYSAIIAPVTALNDALIGAMKAGRTTPFEQRLQSFAAVVQGSFDLPLILRNSIGPRFASFSAEQQGELLATFTDFTAASYIANFDNFAGERFDILPDTRRVGADEVVQTRIVPQSGDPTRLDYVVRAVGGSYKIVDVLLDGSISRVAVQRSDFRSLVTPGDPAALIASLRNKVAGLTASSKG